MRPDGSAGAEPAYDQPSPQGAPRRRARDPVPARLVGLLPFGAGATRRHRSASRLTVHRPGAAATKNAGAAVRLPPAASTIRGRRGTVMGGVDPRGRLPQPREPGGPGRVLNLRRSGLHMTGLPRGNRGSGQRRYGVASLKATCPLVLNLGRAGSLEARTPLTTGRHLLARGGPGLGSATGQLPRHSQRPATLQRGGCSRPRPRYCAGGLESAGGFAPA